jgi:hypothetical protein
VDDLEDDSSVELDDVATTDTDVDVPDDTDDQEQD